MKYLENPNKQLQGTPNLGKFGFLSTSKKISKKEDIMIFLKEVSADDSGYTFSGWIPKGYFLIEKEASNANCQSEKVFLINQKAGRYAFKAIAERTGWKGQITILPNGCSTITFK